MSDYIVCYNDVCYLLESDDNNLATLLLENSQEENYFEYNGEIECANSFTTHLNEIIYYDDDNIKERCNITQGKDGTKCSVDIYHDENYQYHITVKNERGENLLILSTYTLDIRNIIRFLDVNMDGYADIQFLEGEGVLNSSYYLYVWDDSVDNFVKVKYDDMISDFKVYDGYLINRGKNNANSGVIEKLVWKGNSLIKESEETYESVKVFL